MKRARMQENGELYFRCPGCGHGHGINVKNEPRPRWTWNGSEELPTTKPSILVTSIRHDLPEALDQECDKLLAQPGGAQKAMADKRFRSICHSFVTDGRIQFLGDCTHALAGQTVDLPELE